MSCCNRRLGPVHAEVRLGALPSPLIELATDLSIGIEAEQSGLEPRGRAARALGPDDRRADGDPRGARLQDAVDVLRVDPADGEPGQGGRSRRPAGRTTGRPARARRTPWSGWGRPARRPGSWRPRARRRRAARGRGSRRRSCAAAPRIRRASRIETSSWPRWTPSQPASRARSGRSFMIIGTRARAVTIRTSRARRSSSRSGMPLSRYWITSAPPAMASSTIQVRSPSVGRPPTRTISRASPSDRWAATAVMVSFSIV